MNLDGLRVNHAGLETAAADMGRTVKEIDDRLNRLEQELAPLRSDWTGSARSARRVPESTVTRRRPDPERSDVEGGGTARGRGGATAGGAG